jgi:hypothetical protein
MLCLSGCDKAGFNEKALRLTVPDVVEYSPAQLNKVADEMQSFDAPMTMELLKDYCVMRDQARALKGEELQCVE